MFALIHFQKELDTSRYIMSPDETFALLPYDIHKVSFL